MIKRSECKCICHTDDVALGLIVGPMHVTPCCYPDGIFAYCSGCKSFKDDDGICKCVGIVIFKEISKEEMIEKWPMKKDSNDD